MRHLLRVALLTELLSGGCDRIASYASKSDIDQGAVDGRSADDGRSDGGRDALDDGRDARRDGGDGAATDGGAIAHVVESRTSDKVECPPGTVPIAGGGVCGEGLTGSHATSSGWRIGCNKVVLTRAICVGGRLGRAIKQVPSKSTASKLSATCGVNERVVGGGCRCGAGYLRSTRSIFEAWECMCTAAGTMTTTAFCVPKEVYWAAKLNMTSKLTLVASSYSHVCGSTKTLYSGGCALGNYRLTASVPVPSAAKQSWRCDSSQPVTITSLTYCSPVK